MEVRIPGVKWGKRRFDHSSQLGAVTHASSVAFDQ